jgi:hypothetical protein
VVSEGGMEGGAARARAPGPGPAKSPTIRGHRAVAQKLRKRAGSGRATSIGRAGFEAPRGVPRARAKGASCVVRGCESGLVWVLSSGCASCKARGIGLIMRKHGLVTRRDGCSRGAQRRAPCPSRVAPAPAHSKNRRK